MFTSCIGLVLKLNSTSKLSQNLTDEVVGLLLFWVSIQYLHSQEEHIPLFRMIPLLAIYCTVRALLPPMNHWDSDRISLSVENDPRHRSYCRDSTESIRPTLLKKAVDIMSVNKMCKKELNMPCVKGMLSKHSRKSWPLNVFKNPALVFAIFLGGEDKLFIYFCFTLLIHEGSHREV